jgi:acetyl-CoA carboxylase carboxyl transferase subunit beta
MGQSCAEDAQLIWSGGGNVPDFIAHARHRSHGSEGDNPPSDIWVDCPRCKARTYRPQHEQLLAVCAKCKYHFRVTARQRIKFTTDPESFVEHGAALPQADPLNFSAGGRSYADKLTESEHSTGEREAFIYGQATVEGLPFVIGAIEMDFIAGSMGSAVGEKITRSMELAIETDQPLVLFSTSGGARMQEGVIALMQLAKVLTRLDEMRERAVPFISVMADPCYGGVTASYAMMGDVNIGEPGAFIGFAGPRVIEQTTREKLPPGAATAEFLLEHGMLDLVVPRSEMRSVLSRLIRIYEAAREARGSVGAPAIATGVERARVG